MSFLRFPTFSARLRAFMLLLGLLPVVLGTIGFALFSRDAIIADARRDIAETVSFQKKLIEDWFLKQANDMDFLAQQSLVRRGDEKGMSNLFMDFMATHPELNAIVYADPDGLTQVDPGSPTKIDVSDREYFKAGVQGKSHISDVLIGRESGRALVIISSPVKDMNGLFGGVVFTVLPMDTVDNWLADLRPGPGGWSYLVGEGDILLTAFKGESEFKRLDTIEAQRHEQIIRAAETGEPYTSIRTGRIVVGATTLLKDGEWRIISEMPVERVLSEAINNTKLFGLACLAALVIVAPISWMLVRSMVQPLRSLALFARDVREGWENNSCPYIPRTAPKEILDLQTAFCSMVDQLEENTEEIRRIAVTDQLTGLANRRKLEDEGPRLIQTCSRAGMDCAGLVIDIDHFKQVNDTYGHAVGDQALVHIAGIIAACSRGSDLPARYGGEEFVVVAPNASAVNAKKLAERIRERVEMSPLDNDGMPLHLTVSVGVAEYSKTPSQGLSMLEDLLGKADSALYQAKASGRNRVCLFTPPNE